MEAVDSNNYKLKLEKLSSDFLLLAFIIYPFSLIISVVLPAISGGMIIFTLCSISSIMSIYLLIINRDISVTLIDLLLLIIVFLTLFQALSTEGISINQRFDFLRYRLLFLVPVGLWFKASHKNIIKQISFIKCLIYLTYMLGLIISILSIVEFFTPEVVHNIYGDKLTPHLTVANGNITYRRLTSVLNNPITLGLYMNISTWSGVYIYLKTESFKRFLVSCSLGLFLFVILFTYSRGAFLSLIAFYLCFVIGTRFIKGEKINISRFTVLATITSLVLVFVVLASISSTGIKHRFLDRLNLSTIVNNPRIERLQEESNDKTQVEGKDKVENDTIPSDTIPSGTIPSDTTPPVVNDIGTEAESTRKDSTFLNDSIDFLFGAGIKTHGGEVKQYVYEIGYFSMLYETGMVSVISLVSIFLFVFIYILRLLKEDNIPLKLKILGLALFALLTSFGVAMIGTDVHMQYPFSMYYPISIFGIDSIYNYSRHNKEKLLTIHD